MSDLEWREFLLRWQSFCFHDHALHGLGIAQSAYAERTGKSASTNDPLRGYEPEIGLWHDYFCTVLPPTIKEPIRLCYLVPGPEKRKYGNKSSRDYYQLLTFARETARIMFNRHLESALNPVSQTGEGELA